MNLQPLYDLKERLESAAIAGAGLLDEDFRLKRARESLEPLAKASPVFARICTGVDSLLAAPGDSRGGLLLDVLALTNAVCYTQGTVSVPGELEPIAATGCGCYCPVSYLQLHPLLEALTTTGSGRMTILKETWQNHPEFFKDYRVLPVLIDSLGDNYHELAELVVSILRTMGDAVLPFLKQGFQPDGKHAMYRRVQAIDDIAGARENDFYLAMLPRAKREIKDALIYALRHDEANTDKLLELCITEKGNAKRTTHYVLACMESPQAWEYWEKTAAKKPQDTIEYMTGSAAPQAGKLISQMLQEQIAPLLAHHDRPIEAERNEMIQALIDALPGKPGDSVAESFRQVAELVSFKQWKLNRKLFVLDNAPMYFVSPQNRENTSDKHFAGVFHYSLMLRPDETLAGLAMELYEKYGVSYLDAALTAQLLTQPAAACYEWARAQYERLVQAGKQKKKQVHDAFANMLRYLKWEDGQYLFALDRRIPALKRLADVKQPIYEPLDIRWINLFIRATDKTLDIILYHLLPGWQDDATLLQRLGPYLYDRALSMPDSFYVNDLVAIGWTDWKGFLRKEAERKGQVDFYRIYQLNNLPLTNAERATELRDLDAAVRTHKWKIKNGIWSGARVQALLEQWEVAIPLKVPEKQ